MVQCGCFGGRGRALPHCPSADTSWPPAYNLWALLLFANYDRYEQFLLATFHLQHCTMSFVLILSLRILEFCVLRTVWELPPVQTCAAQNSGGINTLEGGLSLMGGWQMRANAQVLPPCNLWADKPGGQFAGLSGNTRKYSLFAHTNDLNSSAFK